MVPPFSLNLKSSKAPVFPLRAIHRLLAGPWPPPPDLRFFRLGLGLAGAFSVTRFLIVAVLRTGPLSLAVATARSLRFLRSRRRAFLDSLNLNAFVAPGASETLAFPSLSLPAVRLSVPFSA